MRALSGPNKKMIRADAAFRQKFAQMCAAIGVDPLASKKGFWSEMLGVGDFYFELGVQVITVSIATRELNGGLLTVDDLVARLEGKSSLGRLGLLIHSTAGYVDPGWKGNLTLELSNVANLPIALYHGMRIGQISFFQMTSPVDRPYGSPSLRSRYQGQSEPTASAFHQDYDAGRKTGEPSRS